jgi:hypothetical protein
MMHSSIKSKPVYAPLAADSSGRFHVLLGLGPGIGAVLGVVRQLKDAVPDALQRTRVLLHDNPSAPAGHELHAFAGLDVAALRVFDDTAALLEHARFILGGSVMGTRLYVAGPESFIGRALQIAAGFNLNHDEVRAEHLGTSARRVRCVHCRATTEEVVSNIVRCTGCSRWLMVRDHYSRRFAAYMGVMVDAESPGELPPIATVYP